MNRSACIRRALAMLLALALLAAAAPAALAAEFSAVVTASSMAVYRDADMTDRLGSLRKYSVVRVSGYKDGVARITYNGITGYAASASMDTVEEFAKKALLVATSKIYSSPSRTSDHVLGRKGLRLYVLATKNDMTGEISRRIAEYEMHKKAENGTARPE